MKLTNSDGAHKHREDKLDPQWRDIIKPSRKNLSASRQKLSNLGAHAEDKPKRDIQDTDMLNNVNLGSFQSGIRLPSTVPRCRISNCIQEHRA